MLEHRQEPRSILRVRQVVAQRVIRGVLVDLRAQRLHQRGQLIHVLGVKGVQDLRLDIATYLRATEQTGATQRDY
jgi:hypothetical protein